MLKRSTVSSASVVFAPPRGSTSNSARSIQRVPGRKTSRSPSASRCTKPGALGSARRLGLRARPARACRPRSSARRRGAGSSRARRPRPRSGSAPRATRPAADRPAGRARRRRPGRTPHERSRVAYVEDASIFVSTPPARTQPCQVPNCVKRVMSIRLRVVGPAFMRARASSSAGARETNVQVRLDAGVVARDREAQPPHRLHDLEAQRAHLRLARLARREPRGVQGVLLPVREDREVRVHHLLVRIQPERRAEVEARVAIDAVEPVAVVGVRIRASPDARSARASGGSGSRRSARASGLRRSASLCQALNASRPASRPVGRRRTVESANVERARTRTAHAASPQPVW